MTRVALQVFIIAMQIIQKPETGLISTRRLAAQFVPPGGSSEEPKNV